jgi:hypothetical protein
MYAVSLLLTFYVTGECNMKKSLCFNVACLILGTGLVIAELPMNFAWAVNIGNCDPVNKESGYYCANLHPCTSLNTCVETTLNGQNVFAVHNDVRDVGYCAISISQPASECYHCGKYYCATGTAYQHRDSNNQCYEQILIDIVSFTDNVCI